MTAIVAGEIVTLYSTVAGAAGDSTAGTAAGSLGKYASSTAWAGGALNDLFDNITGPENAANTLDYRGIAILNNNAANVFENPAIFISAETAGGASIALGIDTTAASAKGSASAQMLQIANETTAPAGVTWFTFTTYAAALAGGLATTNIGIAQVKGIWFKRTAANTAALSNDGFTLGITGDTGSL
jgi:hypothetical protein